MKEFKAVGLILLYTFPFRVAACVAIFTHRPHGWEWLVAVLFLDMANFVSGYAYAWVVDVIARRKAKGVQQCACCGDPIDPFAGMTSAERVRFCVDAVIDVELRSPLTRAELIATHEEVASRYRLRGAQ